MDPELPPELAAKRDELFERVTARGRALRRRRVTRVSALGAVVLVPIVALAIAAGGDDGSRHVETVRPAGEPVVETTTSTTSTTTTTAPPPPTTVGRGPGSGATGVLGPSGTPTTPPSTEAPPSTPPSTEMTLVDPTTTTSVEPPSVSVVLEPASGPVGTTVKIGGSATTGCEGPVGIEVRDASESEGGSGTTLFAADADLVQQSYTGTFVVPGGAGPVLHVYASCAGSVATPGAATFTVTP
jgi:hypothetical protein